MLVEAPRRGTTCPHGCILDPLRNAVPGAG